MSASTATIVKWAAAGCGIVVIAVIVIFFCFTDKPLVKVYGQDVYPTSLTQTIKATVKSKQGNAVMRSVKLGVKNFGIIGNPRTQILDKKYVVIRGADRTIFGQLVG